MAVIIIATVLCFVNIILWTIFLNYFKNVSSPEKITERIRESLESLVRDLNNNAERDINLVEGKISELKAVAAEADRRVKILKDELDRTEQAALLSQSLEKAAYSVKKTVVVEIPETEEIPRKKTKATSKTSSRTRSTASLLPEDRYRNEQKQGNLFFSKDEGVGPAEQRALFSTPLEETQPVMREIPVVNPPQYLADIPTEPKKDFKSQVIELNQKGYSDQQIASELGTSVQEVRLVLEFI
ncbi:MAG: hypothetical protein IIT68_04610 [Treponema sp.]|nr:hypothetical protein [Treponema sp.]